MRISRYAANALGAMENARLIEGKAGGLKRKSFLAPGLVLGRKPFLFLWPPSLTDETPSAPDLPPPKLPRALARASDPGPLLGTKRPLRGGW